MAKAKTSITTENRSGSAADAAAKEQRTEMPLSDLHPFEGHPFKVLDDELMEQTVESIKQIGVVSPLIVRPDPEGGFEILSGHRRLHAAQLAGLETVPVIVKEMQIKIIRAKDAIASQKPRIVRCPYCRHNSIIVFEDTRGHVQTKCKACGRETVFNVLEMRRLRRLQLYYSSLNG